MLEGLKKKKKRLMHYDTEAFTVLPVDLYFFRCQDTIKPIFFFFKLFYTHVRCKHCCCSTCFLHKGFYSILIYHKISQAIPFCLHINCHNLLFFHMGNLMIVIWVYWKNKYLYKNQITRFISANYGGRHEWIGICAWPLIIVNTRFLCIGLNSFFV